MHSTTLFHSFAAALILTTAACSDGTADASRGDAGSSDGGPSDGGSSVAIAVPLSLCASASYTLAATLGAQTFDLAVDTGSTSVAIASTDCPSCADAGVSPTYMPGPTAVDQGKQSSSQFVGGSGWSGEVFQDDVTLSKLAKVPVNFVAIQSHDRFFDGVACNSASGGLEGIIGFAPAGDESPGTTGYFDDLVATTHAPDVFATELCNTGGTLWLGGYDPTFTTAAPAYTPMLASFASQGYAVSLVSITVEGTTVPVATSAYPAAIVDTGTPVFVLVRSAFDAVTQAIGKNAQFNTMFGDASVFNGSSCADLTQTEAELDAMLPPLTLTFGTDPPITVQAPATQSYLQMMNYAATNTWCTALDVIDPAPSAPATAILGAAVLRSSVVVFDRANQRIGFAPHTACQ